MNRFPPFSSIALLLAIALFSSVNTRAQGTELHPPLLEGYWQGAAIKGNSLCLLTADFFRENAAWMVETNVPEWTYYSPNRQPVTVNGGNLEFDTWLGLAQVTIDSVYAEMVGTIGGVQLHLKKVLRPPLPRVEVRTVYIPLDGYETEASLYTPALRSGPLALAVFVHGRGCGPRSQFSQQPEVLARHGIAVLTYEKRGSRPTGLECENSMEVHANDLLSVLEKAAQLPEIDPQKIGLVSYSAGGWVSAMVQARSKVKVAFWVAVVAPSTSVLQQQVDCSAYYTREVLGGDSLAVAQAVQYTRLMFDRSRPAEVVFQEMEALLDESETNGWRDVLEDSDIPPSAEELDRLWVRSNDYDPSDDLLKRTAPQLVLLGETDFVVPVKENVARYQELYQKSGKKNYQIVVLPGAGHGMEHGTMNRDLNGVAYTKFDRVAAGAISEMVRFLENEDLLGH